MPDLPFPDLRSKVHQIALDNSGRILLLTYVFTCASEERMSDKQCHEMHLTAISAQGAKMKDMLVDKNFVSSARFCAMNDGKIMLGVRYGALTGEPGVLLQIDTAITKLKPTPLVDQRVATIRKVKLTTFGVGPRPHAWATYARWSVYRDGSFATKFTAPIWPPRC